jgi:hypothetical protein
MVWIPAWSLSRILGGTGMATFYELAKADNSAKSQRDDEKEKVA